VVGKASFSRADVKLTVEKSRAEAFSAFLKEELPLLMEKFFGQQDRE
jgi:ParB family chromosome partitioning protein